MSSRVPSPQPPPYRAGSTEWEPEQQDLGGLGFAGICREIYRVSLRATFPITEGVLGAAILSAFLPAQVAANGTLASRLVEDEAAFILSKATFMFVLLLLSSVCTSLCVFRVASLYCTDGDSDATYRTLRDLPRVPFALLVRMFKHVLPLAMSYTLFFMVALLVVLQLDDSDQVVVLPLQVLGGAACLASAAYVAVVSHIACVVALLEEDAVHFGVVRKSRALLAGKFWVAAAVFVPLDGCPVALQISFLELVLDDALGLGRGFQVAAMAVALFAVVVVTLVAQPVVYLVCKNHHHEVVDKVHLNYVDSDSDVEPTAPQPTATAAQASPPPAVTDY